MSKFVNQEIDPEHVWINISKGKIVRAAVLESIITKSEYDETYRLCRDVYKLEDEKISTVKTIIKCAEKGESVRFYVIEEVKEDNNDVTG